MKQKLYNLFAVDYRALALVRIALCTVAIIDLFSRFPRIQLFYSNEGLLSNHWSLFTEDSFRRFSLLTSFSYPFEVEIFFIITIFFLFIYLIGFQSRFCGIVSYVMMLSIINRNGRILYGGDSVMAATFAWSMCAPMGKRWSVDAILAKNKVEHNDKSLYGFGFLLQIFIIYVVTAYAKSGDTWTRGSAIYYFLNQDRLATDFAVFIREHAPFWFYKFATWSSLAIEFLIPTCIFFPWKNSYIRVLAIGGIWALHFGIFATTTLKVFSLMMIVLSLSLTPQTVLDIIQDKLLFLKKLSIWRLFPSDIKIFPNVTVVFKPIWFIFLFTLLTWHASRSDELFSKVKLPDSTTLGRLVQYISFEQAWNMFSPDAPYGDYFVVFEATLADGSKIDLNTGLPPVYDKLQHGFVKWDREWEAFTYIGLEDGMIDYSEFRRWVFERLPLYVEQPGLPPVKPKQEVKAIKIVLVQDSTSLPGRSRGKVTIKTVFEARK